MRDLSPYFIESYVARHHSGARIRLAGMLIRDMFWIALGWRIVRLLDRLTPTDRKEQA